MKKLGKLLMLLAVMALAWNFTACKTNEPEPTPIVEDGFYVAGAVTGSESLIADYRMAPGVNEADGQKLRPGMYEKYVALEGGKEFYLLLKEGTTETRYGATLTDKVLKGEEDQPGSEASPVTLRRGSLVTGASAPAMKVAQSGLYHIILDLNKDKALDLVGGAQILVAPVNWGTNVGGQESWWTEMTPSAFNAKTMTWTGKYKATKDGNFKFAYGNGWKIQLDDAGKVKANTNLGDKMIPGGADMPLAKGDNVIITLTWKLASGDVAKSYSMETKADKWYYTDYSKAVFSLIGSAFNKADGSPANWDYDIDLPYNASKSTITDAAKFYGTYVYEKTGVQLIPGEFKIRKDHDWGVNFGYVEANIKGNDVANFSDNSGNIKVAAAGTYDVSFKFVAPAKTWELTLTKK